MSIKFNEVTWYSKLGAAVVLFIVLPALSFYIGREYQAVVSEPVVVIQTESAASSNEVSAQTSFKPELKPSESFEIEKTMTDSSNVVGYIAYGAFVMELPEWIAQKWVSNNAFGGNVYRFSPRNPEPNRDYSDISIDVSTTTETNNAYTIYDSLSKISQSRYLGKIITAEVFLNKNDDMRIYHIVRAGDPGKIIEYFYMDGNGQTAIVTFFSDEKNFGTYSAKVREFIQGFGIGKGPRG